MMVERRPYAIAFVLAGMPLICVRPAAAATPGAAMSTMGRAH
jgi:hypothetical protein